MMSVNSENVHGTHEKVRTVNMMTGASAAEIANLSPSITKQSDLYRATAQAGCIVRLLQ